MLIRLNALLALVALVLTFTLLALSAATTLDIAHLRDALASAMLFACTAIVRYVEVVYVE